MNSVIQQRLLNLGLDDVVDHISRCSFCDIVIIIVIKPLALATARLDGNTGVHVLLVARCYDPTKRGTKTIMR